MEIIYILKCITIAPFKEYEERYNFRTYSELFAFYNDVIRFTLMKDKFLKI